jgi:hypothetical protein
MIKQLVDHLELNPAVAVIDSTKLKQYCGCPRKFFYEYVLGWRTVAPSNHLVFGKAVHLAMEHLLLNGCGTNEVLRAYELFLRDYRLTLGPETDEIFEPKTPENFFIALSLYAKKYARDLEDFEILFTEIAGRTSTFEHDLFFRMDSIYRRRSNGNIGSLEHKTASSEYLWADQFFLGTQTGTYTHVLNCSFPGETIEGINYNGLFFAKAKKGWSELRNGQPLSVKTPPCFFNRLLVKRTDKQMNVWLANVEMTLEAIERDLTALAELKDPNMVLTAFPLNENYCSSFARLCEYHNFCNAWPNPWARYLDGTFPQGFHIEIWNPMAEPAKKIIEV